MDTERSNFMMKMTPAYWRMRRLAKDKRGAGAVEFAIVAPILIMAYMGSFELSLGFTVARKVARASSTIADLVAQEPTVTKSFLADMAYVTNGVMMPYGSTGYTLKISGIKVTAAGTGTVVWSYDQAGGRPYGVNSNTSLPADLSTIGAFIVRTEMVMPYSLWLFAPGYSNDGLTKINISKTYYYRQRIGQQVTCSDC